ncbi:MAG: 50S ribosomal protein L13 [Candidatus Marinimicrobia bacterium]|nr:50S ribosomal protein L13 [Candidatus Neomarinimicrobiota bacterium]MCF7827538.1 50S ribosomal protein L13 [Candidatus Neomarinimicrobiota bacterium]MCF7881600.1 50S ribosomal protein L13 [Candidatus Neomarinimicrobiota bacterium]
MKTYSPKASEIERKWYVVDATGIILGRLASEIAQILRGKHKPTFAPHIDCGDHVVVINADKIRLSGRKSEYKTYFSHSGYPGSEKHTAIAEMMERHPEQVITRAVKGMLPSNKLASEQLKKLRVYAGEEHPHTAQQPEALEL